MNFKVLQLKTISILILLLNVGFVMANQERYIISQVSIEGNKTTKEFIIKREVTFRIGDSLSEQEMAFQIERSKENLVKTSLFNYITITSLINSSGQFEINIEVEERWYTFPRFTLDYVERNFSEWLKNGDLSRTNYGGAIIRHNFRGRNEKIQFSLLLGFTKEFSISYNNIIFGKHKQHFMGGEIALTRDAEITYKTENNKTIRYRNDEHFIMERRKASINYQYRPKYDNKHKFYLNYFQYRLDDTIPFLNYNYFNKYNGRLDEITLHYIFIHDKRNEKAYPLHGYKFELLFEQTIGLNHDFNLSYIKPKFAYYKELKNWIFYASGITTKISAISRNTYFHSKAIGYEDNLSGYEPFVVDGQHFYLFKNLLKFVVLPTRITELKFIPIKKFNKIHYAIYMNVFFNNAYVWNKYTTSDNLLDNSFLYSYGIGLDFVTYYDKVFRVEYSINKELVKGIYVHLVAPIK